MNCRTTSRCHAVSHLTAKLIKTIHRLLAVTVLIAACSAHFTAELFGQSSRKLYKVTNKDNKVGFIDQTGKLVIGFDRLPAGTEVGTFSEGLAAICFYDKPPSLYTLHCGYFDETGRIVIPPRFVLSSQFSEGLAWIRTETFVAFINPFGNVAIELPDSFSTGFHEGLAAVGTQTGWGFIDKTGRFITPKRYVQVDRFSDGLAAVVEGRWQEARFGFIDKTGEVAIPIRFVPRPDMMESVIVSRFTEGLAPIMFGKLYGYIDHKGNTVIPPTFRDAGQFSEGLASVTTADGERGYIDKTGLFVIKLGSGRGGQFSDGLATLAVDSGGPTKWGYIDRTGKIVIEPKFAVAYDFDDGLAKVYFSEKVTSASGPVARTGHGYINKRGRFVWRSE